MPRRLSKILFFLLLSGCAHPPPEPPTDTTQGIPAVEYAVISYGNEVEREAKLFLLDSRACFTKNGIIKIVMHFRTQRLVDLCEGRDLIVDFVEGFLRRINSDPTIVCYLNPFPLTADRLKINIEFESFYGRYIDPLYMGRIALERGIVFYYTHDSLDPDTTKWKQRVEPYEKASRFSHFRNEDRMQYPESPNACLGGKYRVHDRSKEHYDHVTSRCCSTSMAIPDTLIMTEEETYPCADMGCGDNTNYGRNTDCDEKMECGLPYAPEKQQCGESQNNKQSSCASQTDQAKQAAAPATRPTFPSLQSVRPTPLPTPRPALYAESLRYPESVPSSRAARPRRSPVQYPEYSQPQEEAANSLQTQSGTPATRLTQPLQQEDSESQQSFGYPRTPLAPRVSPSGAPASPMQPSQPLQTPMQPIEPTRSSRSTL